MQQGLDPLAGLTLDAKRALYDRIALDLSTQPVSFDRIELATWDSIAAVCKDANARNMKSIVESYGRRRYAERCNDIEEFISDSCDKSMRLAVRNSVRTAAVRSLKRWMQRNDILVSVPTLLNCVQYLPGAVDLEFPGYAGARLLHRVAVKLAA